MALQKESCGIVSSLPADGNKQNIMAEEPSPAAGNFVLCRQLPASRRFDLVRERKRKILGLF